MRSEISWEENKEKGKWKEKERSIPFSGDMVRALLDGRKTQLRIPITRVTGIHGGIVTEFQTSDTPGYDFAMRDRRRTWNELRKDELLQRCPFGQIGDRFWVRETFCLEEERLEDLGEHRPPFDDGRPIEYIRDLADQWVQPRYKATDPAEPTVGWKPSILMPRWASRITLEITEVRVQRVQEISAKDAVSEGLDEISARTLRVQKFGLPSWEDYEYRMSPIDAYEKLWDSLFSKKGFGWDVNPWIWAIGFRKIG